MSLPLRWVTTTALVLAAAPGCYTIGRGRVASGPTTTEVTVGIHIVAPVDPIGFTSVFTNEDAMAGVTLVPIPDVPLIAHAGGLWRFDDEAFGGEVGATYVFGKAIAGLGVQHATGDTGGTGAFVMFGYDVAGALCGSCFSGALTE